MRRQFANRREAGRALADKLARVGGERFSRDGSAGLPGASATVPIVLGLPRGGVPVAAEVATRLGAPLDVVVVRKIGTPGRRELAMGAIASIAGSVVTVRNSSGSAASDAPGFPGFAEIEAREKVELERRDDVYRAGRSPLDLRGEDVILVDDGIATGATMRAAVSAVGRASPASVTVAVPVAPSDAIAQFEELADRVVCVWVPEEFWAVGQAYMDFTQTTDDEVRGILAG